MANQAIKELDAASLIILAPPNRATPDQRHSAEEIFLKFRQTKMPYELCREILETSTMDFVLYESVRLIKSGLVTEWKLLPSNDINALKQYLCHYIKNKPTLAPFVREQILQVIAIMVKRKSIEDDGEDSKVMLNEIESLVINGDPQSQLLGCGLISALMQEFGTTVKTSDIGLTWDNHFKAKMNFECQSLKRIFEFCVGALSQLIKDEIVPDRIPLIKHLITIVESVLVWGFISSSNLPRRLLGLTEAVFRCNANVSLRPSVSWQDVILDPMLVQLFFTLYWKIRKNLQIAHHARNCLVQLASLNGVVTHAHIKTLRYLNEYLDGYIKLVSNIEIIDQEAIGMALIVRNIISFFSESMQLLSTELRDSFINQMARLTVIFAEGATLQDSSYAEDYLYMEAFEIMLDGWLAALQDEIWFPVNLIQQNLMQIFDLYLKCHLSPPDGNRQIYEKELEGNVECFEPNDREKYEKQLQIMGVIGRKIPGHSLTILAQLLESCAMKLCQELSQVTPDPKNIFNRPPINIQKLYEDIHWLVLLSGHVLCMESDGETPLIPSEIIQYSRDQKEHGKMDINMSLQLFVSPQLNFSEISANEESFDHVIRLSVAILRLCEIEKMAINGNIKYILSPELSSTIVWFLRRWSLSYLIPNEDDYFLMSTTIIQAFGGENPTAQWAINYFLEKILCNIAEFMGEEELMKDGIQLLLAIVKSKPQFPDKTVCVLKSDRLGQLIDLAMTHDLSFSQVTKRGLLCAIAEIGVALKNENDEMQYWTRTLQLLQDRFNRLVGMINFSRLIHEENVKIQIIHALDCFIGVAQGVPSIMGQSIFRYMKPVLFQLPNLMLQCHNYQEIVQLILELFYECSRGMMHYIDEAASIEIYQCCILTIQNYVRPNINRVSVDAAEEENTFRDIIILMKLLNELLLKDMIYGMDSTETTIAPYDVFVTGLNIIMPLMTMELLKFPSLCHVYFAMISLACETRPKIVCNLPADLLQKIMGSVEMGLVSYGNDITIKCCHIIKSMVIHFLNESKKGEPTNQLMAPFLDILMVLVLSHQINVDLIWDTSTALYYLICCYKEQYLKVMGNFLAVQTDPVVVEKLASAFTGLTTHVSDFGLTKEKMEFRDDFEKFIVSVLECTAVK